MSAIVALAVRLAVRSDAAARRRSAMVAVAAAVGTVAAMVILAFAHADRAVRPELYTEGGMGRLVAVVLAIVGLEVAALAAAAGRLSAAVSLFVASGCALLTIGLAVLPDRLDQATSMARVRRASTRPPTPWRLVPLVVGVLLCLYAQRSPDDGSWAAVFPAAVLSLGVGVVLVVPVFVRLVAVGLERVARGPVLLVAARRLQAQPAGINRVITGLLVGLFVVTGARSVVTAFESTGQYEGAAIGVLDHQSVALGTDADEVAGMIRSITAVQGVRSVTALPS